MTPDDSLFEGVKIVTDEMAAAVPRWSRVMDRMGVVHIYAWNWAPDDLVGCVLVETRGIRFKAAAEMRAEMLHEAEVADEDEACVRAEYIRRWAEALFPAAVFDPPPQRSEIESDDPWELLRWYRSPNVVSTNDYVDHVARVDAALARHDAQETLTCRRCTSQYEPFGGLLFGTPYRPAPHAEDDVAVKIHLCPDCTQAVIDDITGHADSLTHEGAT